MTGQWQHWRLELVGGRCSSEKLALVIPTVPPANRIEPISSIPYYKFRRNAIFKLKTISQLMGPLLVQQTACHVFNLEFLSFQRKPWRLLSCKAKFIEQTNRYARHGSRKLLA